MPKTPTKAMIEPVDVRLRIAASDIAAARIALALGHISSAAAHIRLIQDALAECEATLDDETFQMLETEREGFHDANGMYFSGQHGLPYEPVF